MCSAPRPAIRPTNSSTPERGHCLFTRQSGRRGSGRISARTFRFSAEVDHALPETVQGITTDLVFNIYKSNAEPVPIIRDEELILLRAILGLGDITSAPDRYQLIR